jgi:HAE1 family hydrophobic/amphiphilic exporter-1
MAVADALAMRVSDLAQHVAGVTDVQVSRSSGAPERLVTVDRAKAEMMRLTIRQVAEALQTALSGTVAGQDREGGKEFDIRVRMKDAEIRSIRDVLDLTLSDPEGRPVVLRNVVSDEPRTGPVEIERKDPERIASAAGPVHRSGPDGLRGVLRGIGL